MFAHIGGDQRVVGKGKRQAWTATASEVFFEGLYQVRKWQLLHISLKLLLFHSMGSTSTEY